MRFRWSLFISLVILASICGVGLGEEKPVSEKLETGGQKAVPMEWTAFLLKIVETLAWPSVVLVVFFTLREQLKGLLLRLKSFEGAGVKGQFGGALEEAAKKADQENLPMVPSPTTSTTTPSPQMPGTWDDYKFNSLIRHSPRAAVLEAWLEIENMLKDKTPPQSPTFPGFRVVSSFSVPKEVTGIFEQLRYLRNRADHETDVPITPLEAEEYVQLAKRLVAKVLEIKARKSTGPDEQRQPSSSSK
jgi:hypothetical protein